MTVTFTPPLTTTDASTPTWHAHAVAQNSAVVHDAMAILHKALPADSGIERILLRAAAGAGKSFTLKEMVQRALEHPLCKRVGITAFTNKQIEPLAADLGTALGKPRVCLLASKDRIGEIDQSIKDAVTVVQGSANVPKDVDVLVATSAMYSRVGPDLRRYLGLAADNKRLFDVMFVDEAWQLALYLYRGIDNLARVNIGVGDVGQLPPLDKGNNPWRGDPGYNPYRAWPTAYEDDKATWSRELPAVWRPTFDQLALWRAFYAEWEDLSCVAGPGDRSVVLGEMAPTAATVWNAVGSGIPTLVEVDGLPEPEAPDVDGPLLTTIELWLDELLTAGLTLRERRYNDDWTLTRELDRDLQTTSGNPLIAVLATRNQAVDDATAMVRRLEEKHDLPSGVLKASTVDSWQGQTNGITVALHPLSGASQLDEFNSAFGRLAVTCTRATHGLLLVSRAGLDDLLNTSPARPGIPFGEPGNRQLPRQTHQRILETFQRGYLDLGMSVTASA